MGKLKIPFAVNIGGMSSELIEDLYDVFCTYPHKNIYDAPSEALACDYYGIDTSGDIIAYTFISSFDSDEYLESNVTLYTYEEVMASISKEDKTLTLPVKDNFVVNEKGGVKDVAGKLRWTLLPLLALKEVVKVLEYGAVKYKEKDNWQKVEKERYKEALWRHWVAYQEGETYDPETGLHHLAHLTCDALFIIWMDLTGKKDE